jgi:hypothetical protein
MEVIMTFQAASYAGQNSSGYPLIVNGVIDIEAVKLLAKFNIAQVAMVPWAKDIDGHCRCDVPQLLRYYNPDIKLFLYAMVGNQWLPPGTAISPTDKSAYADMYHAIDNLDGWLYGTDGQVWTDNYRVNMGKGETAGALTNVYSALVKTHLFNGIFFDCCSTHIAWTSPQGNRQLDIARAGFNSPTEIDDATFSNVSYMIGVVKEAGGPGFQVVMNGIGPRPTDVDIDFREGLGSLISVADAKTWMETPGPHWLMSSYGNCPIQVPIMQDIATHGHDEAILSCGSDRGWPPYLIPGGSN